MNVSPKNLWYDAIAARFSQAMQRPLGACLALFLGALVVLAVGLHRTYPFHDDVSLKTAAGNDWLSYKMYALSIVHGGMDIPAVKGPYFIPGGFLYNYFIAAIFALTGPNSVHVYLVQCVMTGLSIVMMFLIARPYFSPEAGLAYLVLLPIFTYFDWFHWYGTRLLSENLIIFLLPLALLALLHARRRGGLIGYAIAGLVFGLMTLTRQHLFFVPLGMSAIIFLYGGDRRRKFLQAFLFLFAAYGAFIVLPIRNAAATGVWVPKTHYGYFLPQVSQAMGSSGWAGPGKLFGKRAIYTIGILIGGYEAMGDQVVVNKHWLIVSVAAIAYVILAIHRRRLEYLDALCMSFLIISNVTFILLPPLSGYGMRFQMPYLALVLFLAMRFSDATYGEMRRALGVASTARA